jgi:DNA-binding XRE family transcriptional regulator
MLDDLAGKRTGERIQILRERKGLSRPVLAGLVGMSASWLKGIEQGRRLPPRLPVLVKLAEALAVGDMAVLAGTDMDLGGAVSVPVASFARIPHDAVPAIRDAVRDPMLSIPGMPSGVDGQLNLDPWHDPVPLEYSIARLTFAIARRPVAVMVGWPGAAQDRLSAGVPVPLGNTIRSGDLRVLRGQAAGVYSLIRPVGFNYYARGLSWDAVRGTLISTA